MTADAVYLHNRVDELLARLAGGTDTPGPTAPGSALDRLAVACSLSSAECDLLVLLAALAIDSTIASQLGVGCCNGGATLAQLADLLPDAGWEVLAPTAPLRRWNLLELTTERILSGSAYIDERTLLGLMGVQTRAPLIDMLAEPTAANSTRPRSERQLAAVDKVLDAWRGCSTDAPLPLVVVSGHGAHAVALEAATQAGLATLVFRASRLPADPQEQARFAAQLEREAAFCAIAAVIDTADGVTEPGWTIAQRCFVPTVVTVSNLPPLVDIAGRQVELVDVGAETFTERTETWRRELGSPLAARCNGATEVVAHRFVLDETQISRAAAEVRTAVDAGDTDLSRALWSAARTQARPDLDVLATRVATDATWDSLVLPEPQKLMLHDLVAHVRHAHRVHEEWGFARANAGGQGVTAMFHGPSGVGKTLAARVIATELDLDLYRVDLAQTVSKYIGETEKNLARIFDAADAGAAVLVFDEADAIFGKRSEVKDANDRFANIEVAYLLQRLEHYRGLAILTTNLPANIDPAFMRRLRSSVAFPFPDVETRKKLWLNAFPSIAPTEAHDVDALARLSISGGSVANIALGAAVLAADAQTAIGMHHLLVAAQAEYAKLDRSFTAAETNGWISRPAHARRVG
jgi:hypothetical protein